jgi:hypothetical protein
MLPVTSTKDKEEPINMRMFSPRQLCTIGLTMSWLAAGTATAQTPAPQASFTLGTTGDVAADPPGLPATGTGQSAPAPATRQASAAPAAPVAPVAPVAPAAAVAPVAPVAPAAPVMQQTTCNNPQMASTQGCKLNAAANDVNNGANAVAAPVNAASNAAKQIGAAFGGLFQKPAPAPAAPTPPPQTGQ